MDAPNRLVVGAALVDRLERPSRVLAARRVSPPEHAGGWELPGGKVEPGELPREALVRELAEELGVTIVVGDPVLGPGPDSSWPLGRGLRMLVWLAEVRDGIPAPGPDHDAVRWLTAEDRYAVSWLPGDLPVVEAVASRLVGDAAGP
ncbi:MAG: (deoxy)nucleoside triphosphate pyrophosphohydrolase [Dermatophilaceae bacterium]